MVPMRMSEDFPGEGALAFRDMEGYVQDLHSLAARTDEKGH